MATPVTQTITKTVAASATASATARAAAQGGILEHGDPSKYDPKNPIIVFIIQAGIILIFCRILHFPLSKLRQPRVIAEVIGGILLGPSVLGRIPGFRDAIFPAASIPNLTLVANLGLVLFLFLVGLEVDLRFLFRHWRHALTVGIASMAIPFGLGCAIAYGLYHQFREDAGLKPIAFGTYMLFVGVAMAITAFPVLCRILIELKLLQTPVGVIVLAAGVGNDVVGWVLLALCVALVNSGSGITALYVLLTAFGYVLFLTFAIRPAFLWVLRRSGSIDNGPTQSVVALTLLLVLTSAFFTGVIGIHPIFGAFIIGLICPHEGGFAIKMTEKVEDLVSTILLPLYFALSGLSTDLGLLDSGITWGYVIGVIAVAFSGKMIGATLASRLTGMLWRESLTIGSLMSCKGLVELIVLNIGLQAKILSQRTFTIFVVMALVTTFATTPLASAFYPEWYQKKLDLWKKGKIDWDGNPILSDDNLSDRDFTPQDHTSGTIQKLFVYLRLDALPGIFEFIALLGDREVTVKPTNRKHHLTETTEETSAKEVHSTMSLRRWRRPLDIHGLHLVEFTERYNSLMQAQVNEFDSYTPGDPVVNAFRTFGRFNAVAVAGDVAVVPQRSYAETLLTRATDASADLVLVPWSESGSMTEEKSGDTLSLRSRSHLPTGTYTSFVNHVLDSAPRTNIAVFVDRGFSSSDVELDVHGHHIFLPYFGGPDDHFALRFALRLAQNQNVTLTVMYFDIDPSSSGNVSESVKTPITSSRPITPKTARNASTFSLQIQRTAPSQKQDDTFLFSNLRDTLPTAHRSRVVFQHTPLPSATSTDPLPSITETIEADLTKSASTRSGANSAHADAGNLVLLGRGSSVNLSSGPINGNASAATEVVHALGRLGASVFCSPQAKASLMVVQSVKGNESDDVGLTKLKREGSNY